MNISSGKRTSKLKNGFAAFAAVCCSTVIHAQTPTNGDDIYFRSVDDVSTVIHLFSSTGSATFTAPANLSGVEFLVVAGGGGGGRGNTFDAGGGGGGGGVLTNLGSPIALNANAYAITVGSGGVGGSGTATNGGNSSFLDNTAIGGGSGGIGSGAGAQGGSGGGGASGETSATGAAGGSGVAGQGNAGGAGRQPNASSNRVGGGGGGAGAIGESATGSNATTATAGDGGAGLVSDITGVSLTYGSGGGGGARASAQGGSGTGGVNAGNGAWANVNIATSGVNGFGGGGGGGAGPTTGSPSSNPADNLGGNGGSGAVVVRYTNDWAAPSSAYALQNGGAARNVLVEDSVNVEVASGNSFQIVSNGTLVIGVGSGSAAANLIVDGNLTMNAGSVLRVNQGASIGGSGSVSGALTGAGAVNPGNSPGILTATQVNASEGMDFNFEFTLKNADPVWASPTASGNDVLRLTDATTPFTSGLTASNLVNIYLDMGTLSEGDTITGGFYTDLNTSFLSSIENATFAFYLINGGGAVSYNGLNYDLYTGPYSFEIDTIQVSANFGSGSVDGFSLQVNVVPEPQAVVLVLLGFVVCGAVSLSRKTSKA